MFDNSAINFEVLKQRAHNLRWAAVPDGVIPLTAADPDFPCAPEIADAICRFSKERYWSYGPVEGMPAFKEAMAAYFAHKRNIPANPAYLFPVDSAAFGIYLTCRAFLGKGDEAIIFDPVDFLFRYSVESVGGVAVPFAIPPGTDNVDFAVLEQLVTPRTKLICLCNPLNPTGKVFTREELLSLAAVANRHNITILSDEIWSDIVFEPHAYTSIASLDEETRSRTVTVTGFSKSYGLAGLRIGAVMAHNEAVYNKLIEASQHRSTVHGANIISQVAATAALSECGYWLADFLKHLQRMRDLCVREFNTIPGVSCIAPEGCYVAFANIKGTNKTEGEIHELLMKDAKVAVVPGLKQWFGDGAAGHIRISFATSEEVLNEAFSRIKNTMRTL